MAKLVDRSLGWSFGLQISTGHRAVVLRRYIGGQGGPVLYDVPGKIRRRQGSRLGLVAAVLLLVLGRSSCKVGRGCGTAERRVRGGTGAELSAWSSPPPLPRRLPLELADSTLAAAPGSPLPPLGLEPVARQSRGPTPVGAAGRTGGGGASSWTSWSTPAPADSAPEAAGRRPSSSCGASRRRAAAAGTAAREGAAALAEASLFLFEKAYWTWKVSVRKLLHQVSAECKLGAYGLVSLTHSVSLASTRIDLVPRLCYALRRWTGSDARPLRAAACTTAALPRRPDRHVATARSSACRGRAPPPRMAPSASSSSDSRGRVPPPPTAPPAAIAPRHAHELAAAVALVKLRRPWSGPAAARSSAGCGRAPAAAGTARVTTPRP
ncbi:Holliday junction resolvase MOC1, chloroplastic-like [Panicum virgatum]|uniref:Holliday junction resolvase MOC1, chloroplastic-like n=1 Tax=Panicum virgatum TaxID=38727 RepID=UPI0019D65261|nr:Holliday junction resolvase MOC1, chloroplastic-like [Panicum virgatum]